MDTLTRRGDSEDAGSIPAGATKYYECVSYQAPYFNG